MKARIVLALAVILIMVSSASVTADSAVVPFKGAYVTHPKEVGFTGGVITLEITAEGEATHLGLSTWYADSWVDTKVFPLEQTGVITFTAANGDKLFMTFGGIGVPTAAGIEFSGDYTITGGDGRFEGAGGAGKYKGSAQMGPPGEAGLGEIYFDGTLAKPERP